MTTQQQLDHFYRFATQLAAAESEPLSLDDLDQAWRARHPTNHELAQSVTALQLASADLQAGDTGIPARAALRDACRVLALMID